MKLIKLDNWNLFMYCNPEELEKVKSALTYSDTTMQYNFRTRKMERIPIKTELFDKCIPEGIKIKVGWVRWILHNFESVLDDESVELANSIIFNDEYEEVNFEGLYDSQNYDVNELLKYRRSIYQCYTGYGKSEVISKLVKYFTDNGLVVLIVTPSSKPLDEIKHRIHTKIGLDFKYFDYDSNVNAIAVNGFLKSGSYDPKSSYWSKVDVILADEVEYDLTEKAFELYQNCTNLKFMYGFSATADKALGKAVLPYELINNSYLRNCSLIKFFGFASVFRKPTDFNIELDLIRSSMFDGLINFNVLDPDKSENLITDNDDYNDIITKIYGDKTVCQGLYRVASKEDCVFIPINRLQLIDNWVHNYFNDDYNTIVISSRGYELFKYGVLIKNITIDETKNLINSGDVKYIFGTKSAFSALDFKTLKSIICLHSSLASITLQTIGRVSRTKSFKVIMIEPSGGWIPIYSNDYRKRLKLIKEYFSDSNLKITYKSDTEL